jgi:hypothetical protein
MCYRSARNSNGRDTMVARWVTAKPIAKSAPRFAPHRAASTRLTTLPSITRATSSSSRRRDKSRSDKDEDVRSARRNHYQSFRGGRQRQQRRRVERSDRGLDAVELSDAGERYRRPYRRGRLHARAYQRLSIHAARRRDRWRRRLLAHAVDVLGQPTLTEFRGCAGSGVVAKDSLI